jgi:hypothetical protein
MSRKRLPTEKLNIDTATVGDLVQLPGVNKDKANKIVEARRLNNGSLTEADFITIPGIHAKVWKRLLQDGWLYFPADDVEKDEDLETESRLENTGFLFDETLTGRGVIPKLPVTRQELGAAGGDLGAGTVDPPESFQWNVATPKTSPTSMTRFMENLRADIKDFKAKYTQLQDDCYQVARLRESENEVFAGMAAIFYEKENLMEAKSVEEDKRSKQLETELGDQRALTRLATSEMEQFQGESQRAKAKLKEVNVELEEANARYQKLIKQLEDQRAVTKMVNQTMAEMSNKHRLQVFEMEERHKQSLEQVMRTHVKAPAANLPVHSPSMGNVIDTINRRPAPRPKPRLSKNGNSMQQGGKTPFLNPPPASSQQSAPHPRHDLVGNGVGMKKNGLQGKASYPKTPFPGNEPSNTGVGYQGGMPGTIDTTLRHPPPVPRRLFNDSYTGDGHDGYDVSNPQTYETSAQMHSNNSGSYGDYSHYGKLPVDYMDGNGPGVGAGVGYRPYLGRDPLPLNVRNPSRPYFEDSARSYAGNRLPGRPVNPGYPRSHLDNTVPSQQRSSYAPSSSHQYRRKEPKLAQYDGKVPWRAYETQLRYIAYQNAWSEDELLDRLVEALRDQALIFYSSMSEETQGSYALLSRKFNKRFGPKEPPRTVRKQLGMLKQKVDEKLEEFAERALRLSKDAWPEATPSTVEAVAVEAFLQGCANKEAAFYAMEKDPDCVDDALELVNRAIHNHQAIFGRSDTRVRSVQFAPAPQSSPQVDSTEIQKLQTEVTQMQTDRKNDILQQSGTMTQILKLLQKISATSPKTCYRCHKPGHFANSCPESPKKPFAGDRTPPGSPGQPGERSPKEDPKKA